MMRGRIAFLVLCLAILACGQYITPTATVSQTAIPATDTGTAAPARTQTPADTGTPSKTDTGNTAMVVPVSVNVRSEPDGDPTGEYLNAGDTVTIVRCVGDWCKISKPVVGWVFKGCLTIDSDLGCTAK